MVDKDSILRRLPPQLEPRQTVFLDGIRHDAEIAAFAYDRLSGTLTSLVLAQQAGENLPPGGITSAFLDAWAFVDAVDRFRSLVHLAPGISSTPRTDGRLGFRELSEPIHALRNVADHLAQRVDYVVAHEGTALGCLKWVTVLDPDGTTFLSAALLAGTLRSNTTSLVNPAGLIIRARTDHVYLAAGEHSAALSDIRIEMGERIASLEESLERAIARLGLQGQQAGSDTLITAILESVPAATGDHDGAA